MTEDQVQAAFQNWGPRFVVRGVDYGDVLRLSRSIRSWADWLPAWAAIAGEHAGLAAEWDAAGARLSAGQAWNRAALGHHFARFLSVEDEAGYLTESKRAVGALVKAHAALDPSAERLEVELPPARLAAVLRRPPGSARPPLVLLIPGLDSTKEEFLLWEEVFLARGLATLSLDGPGQGEGGYGQGRMRPDYEAAVTAVLDALAARADLDLGRVGAAGVSVGGYYVVRALAFEQRVRAAVAIGGPFDLAECWERFPPMTRRKACFHLGQLGDAEAVAALRSFNLEGAVSRVRQPLLIVFGRQDRLVPWQHAERLAREVAGARLLMYEDGNHCCTNLYWRHTPLAADWLREKLAASAPARPRPSARS